MRTAPVGDDKLFIFVGDGVLDVPLRTVPVLFCRSGRLCPPWMTAAPRRAGPMCPAVPSAERCHSEPVRAAKQVPLGYTLARESAFLGWGERIAASLRSSQ